MEELAHVSSLLVKQTKTQISNKTEKYIIIAHLNMQPLNSQPASQFWSLNNLHLNQFTRRSASWFQQNAK
jgi:hypothetical protein